MAAAELHLSLVEVDGKYLCVSENIHMNFFAFSFNLDGRGCVTFFSTFIPICIFLFSIMTLCREHSTIFCYWFMLILVLLFLLFWIERIYYFLSHFLILMSFSFFHYDSL